MLVEQAFEKGVTLRQIEYEISISLQNSQRLMAMKGQIKLKKHFVWER
jgi:hypothetical protein